MFSSGTDAARIKQKRCFDLSKLAVKSVQGCTLLTKAAIDVSLLGKSKPYESLPDTFILFFCTFDYLKKALPVYTFKTMCSEDNLIKLDDGITKIIINSQAAAYEKNEELKVFLEYMNGKVNSDDEFIQKLEHRIKEVKANEELRREYMLVNTIERDARNDGWKAGVAHGLAEGKSLGLAEGKSLGLAEGEIRGSRQAKVETAKNLLQFGLSIENIAQATGLSKAEVEAL
ncbi:Rpn family recombination-promoting nuclease/putative transposase [Treponema vincentii]|uniref:Rpn family recombination-promoting nuclease/putative transposase n=1 Tax=Treponema vincentii TaxID=69710 RepID=A0A6P1Y3P6_9SPIR|nr:Rpn family recombination-promoting nuclease/putative transposase [Treponema vincentii]